MIRNIKKEIYLPLETHFTIVSIENGDEREIIGLHNNTKGDELYAQNNCSNR